MIDMFYSSTLTKESIIIQFCLATAILYIGRTYYYLGLASLSNQEEWNAAKYFKHVIKIDPDNAPSRFQLINVYLLLNKKREASKECDILYMLDRELYYSAKFCNK